MHRFMGGGLALILFARLATSLPTDAASEGPVATVIGAGDIASCAYTTDSQTAALLDDEWGTVLALGDNAYNKGSAEQYQNCYGPTWGRHLKRTRPVPGNHEYQTAGAAG